MTADLPDRQRTPVSARALNMWLRDAQTRTGVGEKRIGWLLASTVAVAALQRALGDDEEPLFLLKGGLFMEFHLGLDARVTKDVDALFRGGVERFESALDAAISEPWGPFTLQRTAIEEITGARPLAKPRRFDLKLLIKGTIWRRIKVEISFPEGHIADGLESVPTPRAGFFGITTPDHLSGIAMAYQVAQKLHACTDPDDPPEFLNDRVRDVVDLLLIRDRFYGGLAAIDVRAACVDVFSARAAEASEVGQPVRRWPPVLAVPNEEWVRAYPALAESVDISLTLDQAVSALNDWILSMERLSP
jgi:hypothetical protein